MEKERIITELEKIVGKDDVLTSEMELQIYGYDASLIKGKPDFVVIPESAAEVSHIAQFAHQNDILLIARGSGTSLSGGPVPSKGGIVMLMTRMNRILEIDLENQRVVVEPGAITLDIKNAVAKLGYLYQPDPASEKATTIGGNLAENSGGPLCFKYGVTSNHVLGAEVVLADGQIIKLGGKALDNPGFDLIGLITGSEGTLAIATKIILRIMPKNEAVKTLLAIFNTVEDGANTVSGIVKAGMVPATLEMMDNVAINAVESFFKIGLPIDAAAMLLIELDGLQDGLGRLAEQVVAICKANNVRDVKLAKTNAERDQLWMARKGAFGATGRLRPNYLVNDGTVPRTKLPETLRRVGEIGKKYDVQIANVFHAGDGNLHPLVLFDERDKDELARVHKAAFEIMQLCVEMGGTITGEHGVGVEKLAALQLQFCSEDIAALANVKMTFDPEGVLNPGKLNLMASEACGAKEIAYAEN
ncbi:MAG: FAD-binding protein [Syntrophobacterales bacterium]|nr:FAD-binding protein [Syntrophobacterales bacterium]